MGARWVRGCGGRSERAASDLTLARVPAIALRRCQCGVARADGPRGVPKSAQPAPGADARPPLKRVLAAATGGRRWTEATASESRACSPLSACKITQAWGGCQPRGYRSAPTTARSQRSLSGVREDRAPRSEPDEVAKGADQGCSRSQSDSRAATPPDSARRRPEGPACRCARYGVLRGAVHAGRSAAAAETPGQQGVSAGDGRGGGRDKRQL